MLYSTVLVAVSALAGFASAQNTTFDTPIPCCQVPVNSVPQGQRSDWCAANQNTCVDICGGQGNIASNGNNCDDSTLNFTCRCSNGTNIDNSIMRNYEQTVPGQMCRFWFGACINATGTNAAQQFQCRQAANSQCGNLTTRAAGGASSSASAGSTASRTGGGAGASNTAGSSPAASSGAANALAQFGTPVLAGGLLALFGIAL